MSRSAGAITALLLCSAAVLLWVWPRPDSDQTTEAVAIDTAPAATVAALEANRPTTPVQRARGQEAGAQPATGDDLALAPDGGALPDMQALEALGAVVADRQDIPSAGLPSPEVRLAQAREAIVGFADALERLEAELREAQQTGVTDTSSLERRLAAASRSLELARFAERANEAEVLGHPL